MLQIRESDLDAPIGRPEVDDIAPRKAMPFRAKVETQQSNINVDAEQGELRFSTDSATDSCSAVISQRGSCVDNTERLEGNDDSIRVIDELVGTCACEFAMVSVASSVGTGAPLGPILGSVLDDR